MKQKSQIDAHKPRDVGEDLGPVDGDDPDGKDAEARWRGKNGKGDGDDFDLPHWGRPALKALLNE